MNDAPKLTARTHANIRKFVRLQRELFATVKSIEKQFPQLESNTDPENNWQLRMHLLPQFLNEEEIAGLVQKLLRCHPPSNTPFVG